MRRFATAIVLLATLAAFALQDRPRLEEEAEAEAELLELLNRERTNRGKPALRLDPLLVQAARRHADRMAAADLLAHRLPGEDSLSLRIAREGFRFTAVAENIGFSDVYSELHPSWMNSPGHRANILSESYAEIGIGVAHNGRGYYAVQNFARALRVSGDKEAADAFRKAVQRFRRTENLPALDVEFPEKLRDSACVMGETGEVSASLVPLEMRTAQALAFTASDPGVLPEELEKRLKDPLLKRIRAGLCFRVNGEFPGGAYFFTAIL